MDFTQLIKDYGGHILGFLGLAQVWAIALWKRWFSKGKLTVYETATIEVGFSTYGPTITLLGTLRAATKDVFVRRMKVRVVRKNDKAEHVFLWRAFRPSSISLGATSSQTLEIAGSFLVTTEAPRQYNVFFASAAFASQYESHVQPLRDAWLAFLEAKLKEVDEGLVRQMARVLENPALSAELFTQFAQEGHATALHTTMSNGFFWHAGQYELCLDVETEGQAEPLTMLWKFQLTNEDEHNLRSNTLTMIREMCSLPVVYNFAYKEYAAA